jgi:DNA repair protein RadC
MESENDLSLVAEVELIYKSKIKASERPHVSKAREVYELFLKNWDKNKIGFIEQLKIMLLNRRHRVLGILEVSTGGVSGTIADPKIIFMAALKANASETIVCHNHPSGCLKPSGADQALTEKLVRGGLFLGLPVVDHLIITEEGFLSFAEEGLI